MILKPAGNGLIRGCRISLDKCQLKPLEDTNYVSVFKAGIWQTPVTTIELIENFSV